MSEGEHEQFSSQVADVDAEMAEFGESLPECAVLIQALELADAAICCSRWGRRSVIAGRVVSRACVGLHERNRKRAS